MAWPDDWSDEEFESRRLALDALLDSRLGSRPIASNADAEFVMMALWLPSAGTGAMNVRHERSKLAKIHALAGELRKTWTSLHPDIRQQMELQSEEIKTVGRLRSSTPLSLRLVNVMDELIEQTIPVATIVMDTAPPEGRRNLLNVSIVEALRDVWTERMGTVAPKSMTEAGPFADFIIAAFETLGLPGNPRAAVDSWREFRAKHPKPD